MPLEDILGGSIGGTELGVSPQQSNALALIKAMQSSSQAGMQKTASPLGSIAQNLLPLFAIPIMRQQIAAKAAEAQQKTDFEKAKLDVERQKLTKGTQPRTLEELIVQAQLQGKDTAPLVALKKSLAAPHADTEIGLLEAKNAGDPVAARNFDDLQAAKDRRAQFLSGLTAQRSEDVRANKEAADRTKRLNTPAIELPEYRNKFLLNKNTLELAPSGIPAKDIEAPGSPWIVTKDNDYRTVKGAKQIKQQLDRLEELANDPDVLPTSRMGIPITLGRAAIEEKPGAKAAEFDRIASFEQLKGIRDFLASGRINMAEIANVGKLNRATDSRDRALAKIKAMRDLVGGTLGAMDLNPDALSGKPPVELDFGGNQDMAAAFEKIRKKYPKMTASEMADYYEHYGSP